MKGSIVFCFTLAMRLITTCPPRCIIPKRGVSPSLMYHGHLYLCVGVDDLCVSSSSRPQDSLYARPPHRLHRTPPRLTASLEVFLTMPPRNAVVIWWTSLLLSANSWAIWSLDKFKPMK